MGVCASAMKKGTDNLYEKPNVGKVKDDRAANRQFEETLKFIQKVGC